MAIELSLHILRGPDNVFGYAHDPTGDAALRCIQFHFRKSFFRSADDLTGMFPLRQKLPS